MRLKFFKSLSVFLSLILFISVINFPTLIAKADSGSGVEGFVERCYTVILGRPSEPGGLAYWTDALKKGERVGTNVAYGFVFSDEYANRNRTNEEFVNDMYSLVLDREADAGGYEYWCTKLENGETRQQVYGGFVNSPEFYGICQQYGITAGYFLAEYDYMQVNNVNLFVDRLYRTCLGRPGDQGGQEYWVRALINKEITGIECAAGFVNSIEYRNNGLSNEDYVENMYSACLGRHSEPNGKAYWVNALVNGMTRDELFAGFANSEEFSNICAEYGIIRGDYTPTEIGTFDPNNPNNIPIPDHTHDYSQKNTDSKYLKSSATCTEAAVYYYSCECGEKGTETFTSGSPLGHNWNEGEVTKEPTEKEEGIKQYKCTRCDEIKTESIAKLNHIHVFDKKVVDPDYLYSIATCTEPAVYYMSCECGEKGTETFTSGTALGHQFDQENAIEDNLKSAATCTEAAVYYKTCVRCGAKDEEYTFIVGEALGHDWDEGKVDKEATATEEGIKTYRCKHDGCNETRTETIPSSLANAKVGEIIKLGKYEQDGNTSNGKEDIEWQVLSVEEERILVISRYALDSQPYNTEYKDGTWENCSLRKWLNTDFLNTAFSDDDKKIIKTVTLENKANPKLGGQDGNDTRERIFCLSLEEAEKYFGDYDWYESEYRYGYNQNLICSPTQYAINNGEEYYDITEEVYYKTGSTITGKEIKLSDIYTQDVIGTRGCTWWLRTPAGTWSSCYVGGSGIAGAFFFSRSIRENYAVRPAMYISLVEEGHTHNFKGKVTDNIYLKKKATCTDPAEYYMSCDCGEMDTENSFSYGEALGHEWDEGEVTTEATATEEGVITYRCKHDGCNETKTEVIPKDLSKIKVGDVITFGKYEQDNNLENGKEDIEWEVLSVEDGKVLLISKNILDYYIDYFNISPNAWEDLDLREWLNSDFMNEAFSEDEQQRIPYTTLINENIKISADYSNGTYEEEPVLENTTRDKIFCLSVNEVKEYFDSGEGKTHIAFPTTYSLRDNRLEAKEEKGAFWALRTMTSSTSNRSIFGKLYATGGYDLGDSYSSRPGPSSYYGIRPAIYLNISSENEDTYLANHVHNYDRKVPFDKYIKGSKCTGEYYMSCECGERNDATFTLDKPLAEHIWDDGEVTKEPTFTEIGEYTYHCKNECCNAIKTENIYYEFTFGKYEQDGDLSNGKEDVEWIVISSDGETAFVISKYLLDYQPFNKEGGEVGWEDCSLREWLNEDFYNIAFSDEEKNRISFTTTDSIEDKIIIIGVEDVRGFPDFDYLGSMGYQSSLLVCSPTEYAKSLGVEPVYKLNGSLPTSYLKEHPENACYSYLSRTDKYFSNKEEVWAIKDYFISTLNFESGGFLKSEPGAIRPAMHIKLNQEEHTHIYSNKVVDDKYLKKEATCTEPAEYYMSCDCGEKGTETFYGEALGHDWDDGEVTTEATATNDGVITYRCKHDGCNETKTEVIPKDLSKAKIGDVITFGKYEQDGDETNGEEDIEWQVLSVEDNRILVVSKYALDCKQYNENLTDITWETCTLRSWLNNDFFNTAFSETEKDIISLETLSNKNNPKYGTLGGNNTEDKVFCLSLEEMESYFGDYSWYNSENQYGYNQKLICTPTQYAVNQGAYAYTITEDDYNDYYKDYGYTSDVIGINSCFWWLRTPGDKSDAACLVGNNGAAGAFSYDNCMYGNHHAVRPAMYIEY